jgi:hypothetical protein
MQLYKVVVGEWKIPGFFSLQEAERKKESLKGCVNDIEIVPVKPEPVLDGGKRDA